MAEENHLAENPEILDPGNLDQDIPNIDNNLQQENPNIEDFQQREIPNNDAVQYEIQNNDDFQQVIPNNEDIQQHEIPHNNDIQQEIQNNDDAQQQDIPNDDVQQGIPNNDDVQQDIPNDDDVQQGIPNNEDVQQQDIPNNDDARQQDISNDDVQQGIPNNDDVQQDIPNNGNFQQENPNIIDLQQQEIPNIANIPHHPAFFGPIAQPVHNVDYYRGQPLFYQVVQNQNEFQMYQPAVPIPNPPVELEVNQNQQIIMENNGMAINVGPVPQIIQEANEQQNEGIVMPCIYQIVDGQVNVDPAHFHGDIQMAPVYNNVVVNQIAPHYIGVMEPIQNQELQNIDDPNLLIPQNPPVIYNVQIPEVSSSSMESDEEELEYLDYGMSIPEDRNQVSSTSFVDYVHNDEDLYQDLLEYHGLHMPSADESDEDDMDEYVMMEDDMAANGGGENGSDEDGSNENGSNEDGSHEDDAMDQMENQDQEQPQVE